MWSEFAIGFVVSAILTAAVAMMYLALWRSKITGPVESPVETPVESPAPEESPKESPHPQDVMAKLALTIGVSRNWQAVMLSAYMLRYISEVIEELERLCSDAIDCERTGPDKGDFALCAIEDLSEQVDSIQRRMQEILEKYQDVEWDDEPLDDDLSDDQDDDDDGSMAAA